MSVHRIMATVTCAVACLGLVACGGGDEEEAASGAGERVTLTVWDQHGTGGNDPANTAAEKIYAGFQRKHPNIRIKRERYTQEQLTQTARTALTGNSAPDVLYTDVTPSREYSQAGLIVPLDEYDRKYGWSKRIYPAAMQWTKADGKLFGLGLEYEFVGVFYNEPEIRRAGLEVPQTLEETLDFCRQAQAKGYTPFAHSQNPGWQSYFTFTMPLHNVVGVDAMRQLLFEKQGSWVRPEFERAVNAVYRDMRDAKCFPRNVNALEFESAVNLYNTRKALMLPTGTWAVGQIDEGGLPKEATKLMPFPSIDGGERAYTAGMGSNWIIAARSKYPDQAAQLIDYVFSDEAARIWAQEAGFIPPVPLDAKTLELTPLKQFALTTLTQAATGEGDVKLGYNVDLVAPLEFNTLMEDGFQAMMSGRKSAQEQLRDLDRVWQSSLEDS